MQRCKHQQARAGHLLDYFKKKNPSYDSSAKIYAVVNGDIQTGAENEFSAFAKALNAETTKFMRVAGHSEHAIAIVCERDPFKDDVKLKYTTTAEAGWEKGKGKDRDGHYKNDTGGHQLGVASTDTWKPIVDPATAQIKSNRKCTIM